ASGIPMMDRAQLLGQIMSHYDNAIAVSGTHGKTTTTSMLAHILLAGDTDPTVSVGGILREIGGNIRVGRSENFLTEACEYTNSFLKFDPRIAIILNIEEDHMDFFKDLADIRSSFRRFAQKPGEDGVLIINNEIEDLAEITEGLKCRVITFGTDADADCHASNIVFDEKARPTFDVTIGGRHFDQVRLSVGGMHNVSNALAAIAAADVLGIAEDDIREGLLAFNGTDRRFEYKGKFNGVEVFDDYAHHPTEIRATLTMAAGYPHNTLWCVFQPHTYTRTRAFLDQFADALALADRIVLADIYAAREQDPGDISSRDIQRLLEAAGKKVWYFPTFEEIEKFLQKNCINGDLLITMGAGNIVSVGESLVK
ncbi:MAG: UDP-N-acetylmuramate--L-alanine ligase, partial [Firmicutes bacterium]|nr:UDP-N-acetylmuramate--L-alanine ligase [Bacillota bacterium]